MIYFIIYCVGFVLSLIFYFWLNRTKKPSYNNKDLEVPFGFAVFLSALWPLIMTVLIICFPFEQASKHLPTKLINRFTAWYEGK